MPISSVIRQHERAFRDFSGDLLFDLFFRIAQQAHKFPRYILARLCIIVSGFFLSCFLFFKFKVSLQYTFILII